MHPAIGRDVGPLDGAGVPHLPPQILHEGRIVRRVRAQAVVQVRNVKAEAQRALELRQGQEKGGGVRSS